MYIVVFEQPAVHGSVISFPFYLVKIVLRHFYLTATIELRAHYIKPANEHLPELVRLIRRPNHLGKYTGRI